MIETIENAVQLGVSVLLMFVCIGIAYRKKDKLYGTLALFYASTVLGDLYWILYLGFYRITPQYSYISEISWYAAWIFLLLLSRQVDDDRRISMRPVFWFIPVFTGAMCVFFMRWGDYLGNLITAVLMALLLMRSVPGCFSKEAGRNKKWFHIAVVAFCMTEYIMWTLSCFFYGDTIANPYLWFDAVFTLCIAMIFPGLRKAVSE